MSVSSSLLLPLDCISLPHHSTLRRLSEYIGLENEFISNLKHSTLGFNQQQRHVSLHMDQIHLKSEYSYKGGKIIGSSSSPNKPAKLYFDLWFLVFTQSGLLSFNFYHVPKLDNQKQLAQSNRLQPYFYISIICQLIYYEYS